MAIEAGKQSVLFLLHSYILPAYTLPTQISPSLELSISSLPSSSSPNMATEIQKNSCTKVKNLQNVKEIGARVITQQ